MTEAGKGPLLTGDRGRSISNTMVKVFAQTVLVLAATLVLAACASLSEDECRGGDWQRIGIEDGNAGRESDFLQSHAKACADYGIAPERTAWEQGRQIGLKTYCTPSRAYNEGVKGRTLKNVCPINDLAVLQRANDRGFRVFWIEREIDEAESDIRRINSLLSRLPNGDPSRASLIAERSSLRLDLLTLRSRRLRYR